MSESQGKTKQIEEKAAEEFTKRSSDDGDEEISETEESESSEDSDDPDFEW